MSYDYCIATHPDTPDNSSNSRGRRYHITFDAELTLCNFIVTSLIGSKADVFDEKGMPNGSGLRWSPTQHRQGMCGNCRQIARQKHISVKDMEY